MFVICLVHKLTPWDISIIAAMGDSVTVS